MNPTRMQRIGLALLLCGALASIATGLLPQRHGIVGNRFPDADRDRWYRMTDRDAVQDGRWYGGEPIWVTAESQGMEGWSQQSQAS